MRLAGARLPAQCFACPDAHVWLRREIDVRLRVLGFLMPSQPFRLMFRERRQVSSTRAGGQFSGRGLACPAVAILIHVIAAPLPAAAQVDLAVGGDAFLRSKYVWRGITRNDGWVFQPNAYLSVLSPAIDVTAGGWANFDMSSPSSPDGGGSVAGGGQTDLWIEAARAFGPVNVSGGFVRYLFDSSTPGATGPPAFDSSELYATTWTNVGPLVPRVAAYVDVDAVRGAYIEAGADLRLPLIPLRNTTNLFFLSALGGWNVGQGPNETRPSEAAYFGDSGFTQADFALSFLLGTQRLYMTMEGHFIVASQALVRHEGGSLEAQPTRTLWWFGIGLSVLVPAARLAL